MLLYSRLPLTLTKEISWQDRRFTIPNNTDPFPIYVVAPIPPSRMHQFPLKIVEAGNVRPAGDVELTHGRHEEIGGHFV